ncbi:MAG: hypothetical protein IJX66_00225 [Lachnospiraceae bacterium]|nr:hypothetical protein [Lachnospiraceae bacterium]
MNKSIQTTISLKRAMQSAVVLLTLLLLLAMWPFSWIKHTQVFGNLDTATMDIVHSEGQLMQTFIPRTTGLTHLTIYLANEEVEADDYFMFTLYDENMKVLDWKEIFVGKLSLPGECRITIGEELKQGSVYYYAIDNMLGLEVQIGVRDSGEIPEEAKEAYFYGVADPWVVLDTEYEYQNLLSVKRLLFYSACTLAMGAVLVLLIEKTMHKNTMQVRMDAGARMAGAILVLGATLWAAWQVFPARRFSMAVIDIVFYEVGILLLTAFVLYGLLHRREIVKHSIQIKDILEKLPGFLQVLAFAVVMQGGTRYINALYNHDQAMGKGILLLGFALVIISGFEKKEIINWYNGVYLFPAGFFAWRHATQVFEKVEQAEEAPIYAWAYFLWGFVLLNTIRILFNKGKQKISIVYAITMVLLFAELIRSRNTRTWPVDIALFWGLFAVRVICKGKMQDYMRRFSDGVFIQYIWTCICAMLYRPFHYYYFIRYSGIFHTGTLASVYFMLVLGLALVRFLTVYKRTGSLKKCWKEIGILGMITAQQLLTLSRTGLLAMIILIPFVLILTTVTQFKDGIKGIVKRLTIYVGMGAAFFVIMFTAYRIVPAVVSEPFIYDFEEFEGSIRQGEEWDSFWFVTVPRFFGVAEARIVYSNDADRGNGGNGQVVMQETDSMISDYSNGRIDIFKAYIAELDWKGHDSLSLQTDSGENLAHAHNSFLQTAYDYGLGAGVGFLVFCIFAGVRSVVYYFKRRDEETALIPMTILLIFGVCGMVERVFFPYYAIGFAFLFVLALLLPRCAKETVK